MNVKKLTLTAAVTAAFALGAAGQAGASVYAGSSLLITDLNIAVVPTDLTPGAVSVLGFSFTANAQSQLNGGPVLTDNKTCSTITTLCAGPAPVLDSATGGRALGDFSFTPIPTGTYANSASQIGDAELVTAQPTDTSQISETEIAGTGTGAASTLVASQTQFLFNFETTEDSADLSLSFKADPNLYVAVSTLNLLSALAQATLGAAFELTNTDLSVSISWSPNGATGTGQFSDCTSPANIVVCNETFDGENLNVTKSLPPGNNVHNGFSDNRNVAASDLGASSFGIFLENLPGGAYTLSLTTNTTARAEQVVREQKVPEPGVLALMGLGLMGLFATSRRRKLG